MLQNSQNQKKFGLDSKIFLRLPYNQKLLTFGCGFKDQHSLFEATTGGFEHQAGIKKQLFTVLKPNFFYSKIVTIWWWFQRSTLILRSHHWWLRRLGRDKKIIVYSAQANKGVSRIFYFIIQIFFNFDIIDAITVLKQPPARGGG